jgi:HlyD family secretion protein
MIEVAGHGDPQIQAGLSKDMIYIKTPTLCTPNTECPLFVADADERSATLVRVQLGQIVGNYMEVRHGLKPGDRVIVSDMSAWTPYPRIDLR